jgi:glutamate--cysteine ligase
MREQKLSVTDFVLQKSREYTDQFRKTPLDPSVTRDFDLQVENSLEQLERLNKTAEIPFDQFLGNYFSKIPEPPKSRGIHCKLSQTR